MGLSASSAKVTCLALGRDLKAQKKGKIFNIELFPHPHHLRISKRKRWTLFVIFPISDLEYYAPQREVPGLWDQQ